MVYFLPLYNLTASKGSVEMQGLVCTAQSAVSQKATMAGSHEAFISHITMCCHS